MYTSYNCKRSSAVGAVDESRGNDYQQVHLDRSGQGCIAL